MADFNSDFNKDSFKEKVNQIGADALGLVQGRKRKILKISSLLFFILSIVYFLSFLLFALTGWTLGGALGSLFFGKRLLPFLGAFAGLSFSFFFLLKGIWYLVLSLFGGLFKGDSRFLEKINKVKTAFYLSLFQELFALLTFFRNGGFFALFIFLLSSAYLVSSALIVKEAGGFRNRL